MTSGSPSKMRLAAVILVMLLPACSAFAADEWPGKQWAVVRPEAAGLDETLLRKARDHARTGGGSGCITRGGKVVLAWGDQKTRYDLKSTTKSFGATALGVAILDQKVALTDRAAILVPGFGTPPEQNAQAGWLDQITLLHLATQTAGFDKPGGFEPLRFEPGTKWSYSDGGPNWLADALTLTYHRDLADLMFERVFTPVGITPQDLTWRENRYRPGRIEGIARREFGSGISANVDAMARIGLLYLRGGVWDGRRLLPEDFVKQAGTTVPAVVGLPEVNPKEYGNASDHYGLLWWNNADGTLDGVPRDAFWSWGLYDSLIVVIPSLDIVAARAGRSWNRPTSDHYHVLRPFLEPIAASAGKPASSADHTSNRDAGGFDRISPVQAPSRDRQEGRGRLALAGGLMASVLAACPVTTPAAPVDFRRDIQPLLSDRCLNCHGPTKQRSELRLDRKEDAFRGGLSGDAGIVPGEAEKSRLFQLVSAENSERMPPRGEPLTPAQIDLIRRWIDAGAEWPESSAPASKPTSNSGSSELAITQKDRDHWAFRPLRPVDPPSVRDEAWCRNPIDRFIRHEQEVRGLNPSAPADARALVRRIYFDLIGLPPELKGENGAYHETLLGIELDLSKPQLDPMVYESLVDRLLASPRHGERWARHWLDVARYADSDGQEGDADRPHAYRFRDFVIRSLNEDRPYDEFVRWQIAGDEIAPDRPDAIAATGFLVAGNSTVLNVAMEEEKLRNRANELDDMVSTTGQALLGLTVACARCHDHKYDPIPSRDYYRLMRVFNSGDRTDVPLASPAEVKAHEASVARWQAQLNEASKRRADWLRKARGPLTKRLRAEKVAELPLSDAEKALLSDRPEDKRAKALAARFKKSLNLKDADCIAALSDDQKQTWNQLNRSVKAMESRKPPALPRAFAFADFGPKPRETWYFERGNFLARNETMDLGFLSVLTRDKPAQEYWAEARETKLRDDSTQQRQALAEWITDLDQGAGALLARVMVNRVWQHHFGAGLVRTVSDFGTRGEPPTHPELLEWLADEFVHSGWSLKHLHRLIVTSASYRQGTSESETNREIDPENRLLWHRRPLRLEAECLRDAMLAVAGSLNSTMFGPSVKPPIPDEAMQARNVKNPYPRDVKDSPENRRRTVYLFHKRVVQYPLSQAFDAPDAQVSCGRRLNTTVAPQALALLNDPFVRLRAHELAGRLRAEAGDDPSAQILRAFQLGLCRAPQPDELEPSLAFLANQADARLQRDPRLSAEKARELALADFCQMLFSLNEFIYID